MFVVNDDNSIYATRGDIVFFGVTAEDKGKPYKFQPGDVVRIKVYGKKDAESVVLQKDFPVTEITEKVDIYLTEADTKFGEVISKPRDYWYEVELNPYDNPQTIIGYDEDGPKLFKLFPEGDDVPEYVPPVEDIPVVDSELDPTSTRPVQNQAIAAELLYIRDECERTREAVTALFVTPEMYGAIGDGVSDDTDAFQQAVDTGKIVDLGAKTYALYGTVYLPVGCQITGSKNSIIHAYAPTVFHISEKNTVSGFTIRVKSADVLSVFEADDNSGGANIAGDGALIFTTIENVTVYRDVSDATPLYTVFHFHVNENSFYGIKVHACTCVCNGTNGYAARVYSNGTGWLSTCSFIDCNTSGFNWHYFFAENDNTILSNSEGMHNLTNCIGQCTPETHGFAFLPNIRSARITNCTTWDWGSATAGSKTCAGKPYVIGPNQERVQLDSICNDIGVEGIATYDGKDFGDIAFDATKAINAGAQYSTHLIPKYTGIPMVPCVKLLTLGSSSAGKRVRFYVCDHRGITYVSIYPYEKKAVLSRPLYDIYFALSADGKTVYMYKNGGNIPSNFGILTIPVSNLMISFGGGNAKNTELTPDVWKEPENRWMDALPSDAVTIPNKVEPNAYVSDEDGNYYKISIVTAADGTKSIGFERAYDSTRETDY